MSMLKHSEISIR